MLALFINIDSDFMASKTYRDFNKLIDLTHSIQFSIIKSFYKKLKTKPIISEKHLQDYFFKNLNTFLPDAKQLHLLTCNDYKPDGLVLLNGQKIPVEVKLSVFNEKARWQLLRYMDYTNAQQGVAVARNYTAKPDDRIIFVGIDTHENEILKNLKKCLCKCN